MPLRKQSEGMLSLLKSKSVPAPAKRDSLQELHTKSFEPEHGSGDTTIQARSKCESITAIVKLAQATCGRMANHILEKIEESKNDQFAEYPFDDGWKC